MTTQSDLTYVYFGDVVKSEEDANGDLYVYGKATSAALDSDEQRCSPDWLKSAMPEWYRWKNVREMHQPIAAGTGVQLTEDGSDWWLKSLCVDKNTKEKIKKGVLKGYSIGVRGAKLTKSEIAPRGMLDGGDIVEISYVDRPANPECDITIAKAAGGMLAPVDVDGVSVVHEGDSIHINKGVATLEPGAARKTPSPMDMPGARPVIKRSEPPADDAPEPLTAPVSASMTPTQLREWQEVLKDKGGDAAKANDLKTLTDTIEPTFDPDTVKGFVADTLAEAEISKAALKKLDAELNAKIAKAAGDTVPPPTYDPEQTDALNALTAIAMISRLICSEAAEMVDNPAEDCDISILLDAVSALRCFIHREQQQAMGANNVPNGGATNVVVMADEPDLTKAKYSAEQLRALLKQGKALKNPNGDPSYPIADKEDLDNAIHAVGRGGGSHAAIKAYIMGRAKALGLTSMLPDSWTSNSQKAVAPEARAKEDIVTEPTESVESDATKTTEPDVAKAATDSVTPSMDADLLIKALIASVEKDDSPLRNKLAQGVSDIVKASTEAIAKSVHDLAERVASVEAMPVPGGPALRRTDSQEKVARVAELTKTMNHYRSLADNLRDADARKGYSGMADEVEAQIKTIQ